MSLVGNGGRVSASKGKHHSAFFNRVPNSGARLFDGFGLAGFNFFQ
jgi:hypothetical protein